MSMRRLCVVLVACGLVEAVCPTPAAAWFGFLDRLSGPGWFKGPQFEVRLACFGEDLKKNATFQAAITKTEEARRTPNADTWNEARKAWNTVATVYPRWLRDSDIQSTGQTDQVVAEQSMRVVESTLDAMTSVGVTWSACSSNIVRRASVDLGVRRWTTNPDPQFAHNEVISLSTLVPSFSWRIIADPRLDVLDAGMGGGVYWFSSPGFKSFSGVILEPWRFDVHSPSSWSGKSWKDFRRWAALPVFRAGVVMFPGGFEAGDFEASGDQAHRISAELVPTYSFFVSLKPFVRKWP
jgi:hypothetical protein